MKNTVVEETAAALAMNATTTAGVKSNVGSGKKLVCDCVFFSFCFESCTCLLEDKGRGVFKGSVT